MNRLLIKLNNKLAWWYALAIGHLTHNIRAVEITLDLFFIESDLDDNEYK